MYYVIDDAYLPWSNLSSFIKRLLLWFDAADITINFIFPQHIIFHYQSIIQQIGLTPNNLGNE